MPENDEAAGDDGEATPAHGEAATTAGQPHPGPYPQLLRYHLMTPTAPLSPGAAVRVYPMLPPPVGVPAQWAVDPTGRHEHRWWTGREWSDHVADAGEASIDPLD